MQRNQYQKLLVLVNAEKYVNGRLKNEDRLAVDFTASSIGMVPLIFGWNIKVKYIMSWCAFILG